MMKTEKNRYIYISLLFWGVACALALVKPYLFSVGNGWIAEFRCERLVDRYNELLTVGFFDIGHNSHALGYGLYFPFFMKFFNILNGQEIYCFVQSVSGMAVVFIYPLLIYLLYEDYIFSLISPILLHFTIGDMLYINKSGEYFSPLNCIVLGVPLLLLIIKSKNEKKTIGLCCGICVIAMLANVMRSHSAFAVVLIMLVVVFHKWLTHKMRFRALLIVMIVFLFTYNLLGTTIPDIVAKKWGVEGKCVYSSSPWHGILMGMGYIDNEYGLYYGDDAAKALVEKYYPDVVYNSDEYFEKCKEIALRIIVENPLFVIKGLLLKSFEAVKQNLECVFGVAYVTSKMLRWFSLIICIGISFLLALKKQFLSVTKKYIYKYGFVFLIIFLSNYTGILATPTYFYNWGACGGCGIILFFFIIESIHQVRQLEV